MFKIEKGKKLSPKEIRKKQEQKRIDAIEEKSKDVKVGPPKKSKPKLTEKEIKANKFGKERQERIERSKKTPIINLIGDILKTPYYIRGGELPKEEDTVIYKSKGGLIKGKPKLAKRGWK
jgi:hypothetical protein